ncbi:MAG: hypothetical protein GY711_16575 [bacterium]|nr:hypothetical protein [bacterium]
MALAPPALAQCETGILQHGDPEAIDVFGWSVDIQGEHLIIGTIGADDACRANSNCNSGAAAEDRFGRSLDLSANVVIVGAHLHDQVGPDWQYWYRAPRAAARSSTRRAA